MQVGQPPQELKLIATRSPGATFATFAPTRSTTPAPSWPSTAGNGTGYHWSRTMRSVWQTPAAATLTRTSSGRRSSTSTDCTANGAPLPSVTAAWISMVCCPPPRRTGSGEHMESAAGRGECGAGDEIGGQDDALRLAVRVVDEAENEVGGGLGHPAQVLADGREPEDLPSGHRDVVEAGDAHVLRHVQAEGVGGVDRADGDDVVGAQHRRRALARGEQLGAAAVADGEREPPAAHPCGGQRDARLAEHVTDAGLAVAAGARRLGTEDRGDITMPRAQRLLGQRDRADAVVDRARRALWVVDGAVEQHEREVPRAQLDRERGVEVRRREDRAVDRAVDEALDALGVVALRGQDDHPHAGALEALVEDVEELEVERVVEALDDAPDPARAAPCQAAAAVARDVAEPLRGGEHAEPGGLGHARVTAQ